MSEENVPATEKDSSNAFLEGLWLHLDVQTGCAGDMLCASLLSLGLKPGILRDGLAKVGLHPAVGPKLTTTKRNGVVALHLTFVDRHGEALEGGPVDPPSRFLPTPHRGGRRALQPKFRGRTNDVVAEAGIEQETDADHAEVLTLRPDDEAPAPLDEQHPAPSDVTRWLAGEPATGAALEARLREGRLSPIAAALSRKALRRLLDSLAAVQGVERPQTTVGGKAAVDILCDIVGFASLLEALNPERVTASMVGVTTAQVRGGGGPEPWVVEVLKGVPTKERDQELPACTPTGAALVWAVTHHFGARLGAVVRAVGVGAGTRDIRGVTNVTRAFLGQATALTTGDKRRFSAPVGREFQREAFVHALVKAGAEDLFFVAGAAADGALRERVTGTCAEADLEAVQRALLVQGQAASVEVSPVEVRRGDVERVTVRIGSAQKGADVDVEVLRVEGEVARVRVAEDSATDASRRLGWEYSAVVSAARLAFERQSGEDADP